MYADIPSDDNVLTITPVAAPEGLALAGEIDESTYPVLVRALERFTDPDRPLHLYLSGLNYCDVAGLRALVGLATPEGPAAPQRRVLHAVPPHLRTALRILGWDTLPGLSMKTEGEDA